MTNSLDQHAADEARWRAIRDDDAAFKAALKQPRLLAEPSIPPGQSQPQTLDDIKAKQTTLRNKMFQSASAVAAEIIRRAYPDQTLPPLPTAVPAKKAAAPVRHDQNIRRGISAERYVGLHALYGAESFAKMLRAMTSVGCHAEAARALRAVSTAVSANAAADVLTVSLRDVPFNASTQTEFLLWEGEILAASMGVKL